MTTAPEQTTTRAHQAMVETVDVLVTQAVFTLTPFFIEGARGDTTKAATAAKEMLLSYQAGSPVEIQLAVECILFAYSAMDNLRKAKVEEMPDPKRLRLRNGAVSLNRASHRNRQALAAYRKARTPTTAQQAPAEPPASDSGEDAGVRIRNFMKNLAAGGECFPASAAAAESGLAPAFMNREQRRSAELAARREARRARG